MLKWRVLAIAGTSVINITVYLSRHETTPLKAKYGIRY